MVAEDAALLCVDGGPLSSPPRLDLLDATLVVADVGVDGHKTVTFVSSVSGFVALLLPFDVGGTDDGTVVFLSAAAAKAAVCFRADRLSFAFVPAS